MPGKILAPVTALLLSVALLIMGNGLQTTLLPIRAGLESFSPVGIGLLGSSYFVGFIIGCLGVPYIILRVGHIRAFTALVALASAAALAHPLLVDPLAWILIRLITGACLSGLYLIIESWLNERATNETRGLVMSSYIVVNFTVITIGQLMVTLYAPESFALFALASILVSLAAIPVALTRSAQPAPITLVHFNARKLIRLSPAGVIGIFMVGLSNGAFWALGPVYAIGVGMSVTATALFMSVAVIGGAIAQWPLGRLSDRMDRRHVMIGIAVASMIAGGGLVILGHFSTEGRMALAFLFGAATLPAYAIAAAQTFDHAAPGDYVEVSAGLLLMNGAGSAFGPLLASGVIASTGPGGLFLYNAAVQAALALFVISRMRVRDAPPMEEREDFDLTSTAPVVTVGGADAMAASPLVATREELEMAED